MSKRPRLLGRCIVGDPRRRLRDVREATIQVEDASAETPSEPTDMRAAHERRLPVSALVFASVARATAARPAYVAAVTQLAECLMRAGSANDTLRRHGPIAELLGSSVPAWPELDARLDGWLDAARASGVKV